MYVLTGLVYWSIKGNLNCLEILFFIERRDMFLKSTVSCKTV